MKNSAPSEFSTSRIAGEISKAGRRPGISGTKGAIEAAARRQFATLGYDRTSLRQVAIEADVDPALVSHFFGSKQLLFADVMGLPVEPGEIVSAILEGDRGDVGFRLASAVLALLESDASRAQLIGLVRAAASEPSAAHLVQGLVTRGILMPVLEALGSDRVDLRAGLILSQMVGMIMARHVVDVEALTAASTDELAYAIGETVQRYLLGTLF